MNSTALWKERFRYFLQEVRTYSKYVFNDHLKFIFVFIIGAGAYYYQQWLQTLTPSFPTALVMAVLLGFVLTAGSIQTLLKEADLVYLLPVEEKLKPYFTKAFLFTFMIQLYIIAIVAAALAPLYFQQMKQTGAGYIWIVIAFIIVKAWNLFVAWEKSFLTDQNIQRADWFIRFILNALFVYFLVERTSVMFIAGIILLMVLYLAILHQMVKGKPLNWEYLISEEGKKMMLLYRIANMFVDVPALKERVARRKWLDFILSMIGEKRTYLYLYTRTFLRSGNYFGLYVRLLALGGVILYFIPFLYGRFIVSLIFLYLIGYQLLTLWKHHRMKIWLDLYPVGGEEKKKDFLTLLNAILIIGSVVFTIIFALATKDFMMTGILLVLSIVFSIGFVYQYGAKRIERLN
ncbi:MULTISPECIES: ABC transporter permease EcsB [Bacillus cereus group]|uniref:ABC transporter permease EcsB n=1 Tax=Bacillus cereus group TaxID=86661 RepID=UPI001F5715AB|nr:MULTISPECIES: ABC transporter permease EcsB [Bacillus cereus group]MDA2662283.1 ABC transporter permease EcsB [Bacillus cereus group sp. Bc032]MDA2673006.1 ABC transporter permease EcsB [Bacillus cereus group sp. Bc031]MDA2678345.1 ABC transporter permease EcsB [Bacillus cereus group sp. Bc029]MDA2683854.1 ABC transporter permease EcsB [Bacillus cereus group sp. Bc030]MDA2739419.1 ABC transporter permease EcsB [Bacillus cereus group sp. Bc011]